MSQNKLDNLYLMRLLVSIVQFESFTLAADHLGITPSKASKDLKYLEQNLGVVLLKRTTRKLHLTDAGELTYHHAEQMITLHEQLVDGLHSRRHSLCGELRITAPTLWGEIMLTPILLKFRATHPQVRLIVDFSNFTSDLQRENIHVAFRSTELNNEPYIARFIAKDEMVLCATKTYLLQSPPLVHPSDLQMHQLLTRCTNYSRYEQWILLDNEKELTVKVAGELSFSHKQAIYSAMKQGLGIALLPRYLIANDLEQGIVSEVLPKYRPKSSNFYAVYTQRRAESALITHFIEYVQAHL
ncbi:LysR family transcriptional regulator [Vibrio algivorus]|uniref:Bistable expression regulator BexR n=1 Tax=Vibrio algivorus TaxID=1667024 RepID=A0ABQ6ELW9_9VIBR|nr:LysR family transcriptional regulator [Vibrio algivorus]GLT13804.1 bistable expression regulator BexR [Vibrio algivorus]